MFIPLQIIKVVGMMRIEIESIVGIALFCSKKIKTVLKKLFIIIVH